MRRRTLLLTLAASAAHAPARAQQPATDSVAIAKAHTTLNFPADFGAHPHLRTEWWYMTGTLRSEADRLWGFQVTFFRSATGIETTPPSAFTPSQLVFAHIALSDVEQRRLRHDQRIARSGFGIAEARSGDTAVALRDWHLTRSVPAQPGPRGRYATQVHSDAAAFGLNLQCDTTQPVLLQGDAGLSRKGPDAGQTSYYYSEPQLAVRGVLTLDGRPAEVQGRAWLDHEWSDGYLPAPAVGWDWIGMNLDDGGALMAFRMRRPDGSSLYAGGTLRRLGEAPRAFGADEVHFTPQRIWQSAASRARYPVQWRVDTPAGAMVVNALFDDQELDSRRSTGAVYWEGLSDLLDAQGRRIGRGYLEMTGYASALRL